jgi:hypothetical protein
MKPDTITIITVLGITVLGVIIAVFFSIKPRFKFFNRCFLCHHKHYYGSYYENWSLKQVKHPGYYTTYHYYHNICLQKVLDSPEQYIKYVDTAIQIQDQIYRDTLEAQQKVRIAKLQIERARAMAMGALKNEIPKKPQEHIEPKLLDRYALLKGKIE